MTLCTAASPAAAATEGGATSFVVRTGGASVGAPGAVGGASTHARARAPVRARVSGALGEEDLRMAHLRCGSPAPGSSAVIGQSARRRAGRGTARRRTDRPAPKFTMEIYRARRKQLARGAPPVGSMRRGAPERSNLQPGAARPLSRAWRPQRAAGVGRAGPNRGLPYRLPTPPRERRGAPNLFRRDVAAASTGRSRRPVTPPSRPGSAGISWRVD